MALVAYGASDDSDMSEDEEEEKQNHNVAEIKKPVAVAVLENGHISDEEEFFGGENGNDFAAEIEAEPDLFSLIAKKLPQALKKKIEVAEDVGVIPEKKDYGEKIEEPPAKKQKRTGPRKITIPRLADFAEDEEDAPRPVVRIDPSKSGSGLFALLPAPKQKVARIAAKPMIPNLPKPAALKPAGLANLGGNNLKPSGVRTVGMVPHRVANPNKPKPSTSARPAKSDSEDEDDFLGMGGSGAGGSYFTEPGAQVNQQYKKINPVPLGPSSSMRSLAPSLPSDPSFVSLNMGDDIQATGTNYEDLALGPAVAPYPPPMPTYRDADNLLDNQEAIDRLAGKSAKRKEFKEDMQIIDINEEDMKGDPRVWLTKAMTEEQAPRPSGKGPKGLAKTRHQITYLAHQAKERDWELKQEWATARENRNASRNKYGFL